MMRGIRGAVQVPENTTDAIHACVKELLSEVLSRNAVANEDIAAIFFTATPDLTADFPAYAGRDLGLTRVPMLGATEQAVPGAMPRMLRVLLLAETGAPQSEIRHVYLRQAAALRPDLSADERL